MKGRVLIIAGSDSSGGAGVQADIKTVTALGGYASSAITALTAQSTLAVTDIFPAPPAFIRAQINAVLTDIGADVIKIGMIGSVENARAIKEELSAWANIPVVLDPVLAATSGDALAGAGVAEFISGDLVNICRLITPNRGEAETLTGLEISDQDAMIKAGRALVKAGAGAALIKGGHFEDSVVHDVLVTQDAVRRFDFPRLASKATHGTGCTLASAIAVSLAQGMELEASVERAIKFVRRAIETAPGFGKGAGPLNHCHLQEDD